MPAPVSKGELCGELVLFFNNSEIGRAGLVADRDAEKISSVKVMKERLKRNIDEIYRKWLTFMCG